MLYHLHLLRMNIHCTKIGHACFDNGVSYIQCIVLRFLFCVFPLALSIHMFQFFITAREEGLICSSIFSIRVQEAQDFSSEACPRRLSSHCSTLVLVVVALFITKFLAPALCKCVQLTCKRAKCAQTGCKLWRFAARRWCNGRTYQGHQGELCHCYVSSQRDKCVEQP